MNLRLSLAGALLAAMTAIGAADPPPFGFPVPVTPAPAPAPGGVLQLTGDSLLVVQFQDERVLRPHPAKLVKVTKEQGPIRIRARFADGSGVETRTYAGPCVFIVEAAGKGRVEFDAIPLGAGLKTEADIVTATVDVDSGTAPQPPPKPIDPKVDPVAPIPVAGLRVLVVYESADLPKYTPQTNGIIFGAKVREWLNANCVVGPDGKNKEWRMWDRDVATDGEAKLWQDAMKRPRTSTPWLIVSNGVTGFEGPLPANADEFLALVDKYKGGGK
jgi:hypothetical protein